MVVRTGGKGGGGLSLMLVPLKNAKGVTMTRIKTMAHRCSGTTFIDLDDVQVPRENLIGLEGHGMKYIMNNFNHERLSICISVMRQSRVALSNAFAYCLKRKAFGKPLMDQPVVRNRLSVCGGQLEAHFALVEQLAYMMTKLTKEEADIRLGGLIALSKAQAGRILNECAQCGVLLHGGNGFTVTGQGETAESKCRVVYNYLF